MNYTRNNYFIEALAKYSSVLTEEQDQELMSMMMEANEAFNQVCPPTRKNFLKMDYVLFKFAELLNLNDLKDQIPLPLFRNLSNPRNNLVKHDEIWQDICQVTGWQFIPSIVQN